MSRNTMDVDYSFLRGNGVSAFTALKIVGMAYYKKEEEKI